MDRKQFLKACTGGLCACATACLPAAADTPAPDWRFSFVQRRYAKLLKLLSASMEESRLAKILFDLGTFCSAEGDQELNKVRGNVAAFAEGIRKTSSGDIVTVDEASETVTMTSPERADCFCPLNAKASGTPGLVCNCSLGWQTHTWETVLQKKVRVELKEAVLRGDKRCTFVIRPVGKA